MDAVRLKCIFLEIIRRHFVFTIALLLISQYVLHMFIGVDWCCTCWFVLNFHNFLPLIVHVVKIGHAWDLRAWKTQTINFSKSQRGIRWTITIKNGLTEVTHTFSFFHVKSTMHESNKILPHDDNKKHLPVFYHFLSVGRVVGAQTVLISLP